MRSIPATPKQQKAAERQRAKAFEQAEATYSHLNTADAHTRMLQVEAATDRLLAAAMKDVGFTDAEIAMVISPDPAFRIEMTEAEYVRLALAESRVNTDCLTD